MYIGLLGPLIVTSGGEQRMPVAAGKQRTLLAALAVQAGDVVPVETLAESIWEVSPPASWEVTIRNYVRRLRVGLGAEAGGRIITSLRGYRLQADKDEVDLLAFEALRKAGLGAARAGDWQRASAKLAEALALWRGTPFADVPSRVIKDAHLPYLQKTFLTMLAARIVWKIRSEPTSGTGTRTTSTTPGS